MPPATPDEARERAIRRVLTSLLLANLAVMAIKALVGYFTGSLAVLGDAVQSSVDGINNVLGLVIIKVAARGPDDDHPYGHAKFETLGALAVVVFLSISIFELVRSALTRLQGGGGSVQVHGTDLALLFVTLLVNIWVAWYERKRGVELKSDLLIADAAHTRTDVFVTIAVFGGLVLTRIGYAEADAILTLVVAGFVAYTGWEVVMQTMPTLLDQAVLDSHEIARVATAVSGVTRAYAIRSRSSGHQRFAELTISVPGQVTVASAHLVTDAVEDALRADLGFDEVVVHVEPC
ncbi:MAG TPA: cation diffusion facilitator family transporter [Gemmatimonadales bacterium]|nr:cation diffusion facilitator family transporter [Gemmatimonadales bacterium]